MYFGLMLNDRLFANMKKRSGFLRFNLNLGRIFRTAHLLPPHVPQHDFGRPKLANLRRGAYSGSSSCKGSNYNALQFNCKASIAQPRNNSKQQGNFNKQWWNLAIPTPFLTDFNPTHFFQQMLMYSTLGNEWEHSNFSSRFLWLLYTSFEVNYGLTFMPGWHGGLMLMCWHSSMLTNAL